MYAVLSDEKQRVVYDETGMVDEDAEALQDGQDWLQYWQLLFKVRAGWGWETEEPALSGFMCFLLNPPGEYVP